jgi:hypothetical protein
MPANQGIKKHIAFPGCIDYVFHLVLFYEYNNSIEFLFPKQIKLQREQRINAENHKDEKSSLQFPAFKKLSFTSAKRRLTFF